MSSHEDKFKSDKLLTALPDNVTKGKITNIMKHIDDGANVNEKFVDHFNNTPLHISVMMEDLAMVTCLLQRGAKSNLPNSLGKTAVDLARELHSNVGDAIVKILEAHTRHERMTDSNKLTNENNKKCLYKKRIGTSGIKGQLYETKLITSIRIRAFLNKYNDFYLGTNVEGIGALDDICIRYKHNNETVVIFLQAKHRTEINKSKITVNDLWKPTGDFSLHKYFDSYVKIRQKLNDLKSHDPMFNSRHKDTKCYSVIYTTAGNELKAKKLSKNSSNNNRVKELIQSGQYNDIFQYEYTDRELEMLTNSVLFKEMKYLGKSLYSFIKKKKFDMILSDCYIRKYHVVLARRVINVSDINNAGLRSGTFREDFFLSNDEPLVVLREVLFNEAVKDTKLNRNDLKEIIRVVVKDPTKFNIGILVQNTLIYYNEQTNHLAFSNEASKDLAKMLSEVKIKHNVYKEAYNIAVKEKLSSIVMKLPAQFGNIDISVSCGKKGFKRLEYLAGELEKIFLIFGDKYIIINDDVIGTDKPIDPGVMDLNGGLGSAIGNLLIPAEEDDSSFQFNMRSNILGGNAKILLEILNGKINDLQTYRLVFDVKGLPKLTLKAGNLDIVLAKDFFDSLWFYTNQAKENEIENHDKEILEDYCLTTKYASQRTTTRARYDAIYFKIHDEVQKWWMTESESYYLRNDRQFFEDIVKEFLENSLLTILSNVYMKRIRSYGIDFNDSSVKSFWQQIKQDSIVLVSEVPLLTVIKLVQYLENCTENYAFIELDSPLLLSRNEMNILKDEIKHKNLKLLIVIYENISESKNELIHYIINEAASKQLIIVNRTDSYEILHALLEDNRKFSKDSDYNIYFSNLTPTSQKSILNSTLIFQGIEVTYDTIIQEEANNLITPLILNRIIQNDKIELGRPISNANYEEIKCYYIDRCLCINEKSKDDLFAHPSMEQLKTFNKLFPHYDNKTKRIIKLNAFDEIDGTVVLIGAPGTGKSSYLTRLSIKTKQRNPTIWIARINLLDYTKEFHRWQQNKIKINAMEALKFVCKAAVVKKGLRNNTDYNYDEIIFNLEMVNGEVALRNDKNINDDIDFEIKMFVHCYNKGKTVLLFDGFDEICPHYKDEITELLKCLVTRSSKINLDNGRDRKQRIWIASRSYNNIIETLETEFGEPYDLKPLTEAELKICIKKYFKINLNLNKLNYNQFTNIDGFFEYMNRNGDFYPKKRRRKMFKYSIFLLNLLYCTAVEYIQTEIEYVDLTIEKHSLAKKWTSVNKFKIHLSDLLRVNAHKQMWLHCRNEVHREDALKLAITPLHMYVALDYFTHEIKNYDPQSTNNVSKWNLETHTSCFYKYFLETKLKRIRYEQKNQMDLYNPDVRMAYERELKEFMDRHKKVAFYGTFIEELDEILSREEIDDIRETIKEFEAAKEKTGVVDYIMNGVPKFIHLTFQEYLSAEYIADMIKTKPKDDQKKLWKFIVRYLGKGVLEFFDRLLESDDKLKYINLTAEVKQTVYDEVKLSYNVKDTFHDTVKHGFSAKIIDEAVYIGLRCTTKFFLKIIVDVITEDNIKDFIDLLFVSGIFNNIAGEGWNDSLIVILDCIRKINPSELYAFDYGSSNRDFTRLSNAEIIREVNVENNCFSRLVVRRRYYSELNNKGRKRTHTI